jgi:hypothetical protein
MYYLDTTVQIELIKFLRSSGEFYNSDSLAYECKKKGFIGFANFTDSFPFIAREFARDIRKSKEDKIYVHFMGCEEFRFLDGKKYYIRGYNLLLRNVGRSELIDISLEKIAKRSSPIDIPGSPFSYDDSDNWEFNMDQFVLC